MRLPPAVRNTCQCLAVASPQLNPAAIQPQKTSLSSSCLVHTHCLHFTHNGRFHITHTAGPLHFALSPGLKCPFPRSSHGWLLPFHLASARSPTSSKKPSRAINPPHNSHEQTSTFGSGVRSRLPLAFFPAGTARWMSLHPGTRGSTWVAFSSAALSPFLAPFSPVSAPTLFPLVWQRCSDRATYLKWHSQECR